mgnify:CR=1 FL=1|jgi:3-oxocholest-4-en-26-oate---CoA ligase
MAWHLGDLLRLAMAKAPSDRPAVIDAYTGRQLTWGELTERSRRLCGLMQTLGIERGDKVAIYARNSIEYVEAVIAILQIGAIHVNVNYRYTAKELAYIFANSDSKAVFYQAGFQDNLAAILPELPGLSVLIEQDGDGRPTSPWWGDRTHCRFEETLNQKQPEPEYSSNPEDQFFMYTGGTTGLPKGVMWSQDKLFQMFGINYFCAEGPKQPQSVEAVLEMYRRGEHYTEMVIAPMMHGLGVYSLLPTLAFGGTVVTSSASRFIAADAWDAIGRYGVKALKIPGDAMGKPLLEALEQRDSVADLEGFAMMISSAAVFSMHIKRKLVERLPNLQLLDILGGSESAALGHAAMNRQSAGSSEGRSLKLQIGEFVRVFTADHREVAPSSGEVGMIARRGLIADGYYKDPERTAKTFPVINGERYCLLGDWGEVLADGTVRFLGRGNVCINTGGEKVFPEEVEQCLKALPGIADSCVVGVHDARWGSAVTALIEPVAGADIVPAELHRALSGQLADYKVPKHYVVVDTVGRGPNGKLDYQTLQRLAIVAVVEGALVKGWRLLNR